MVTKKGASKLSKKATRGDFAKTAKKHGPVLGAVVLGALLARSLGKAWDTMVGDKIEQQADKIGKRPVSE